jgi:hypothetical protein
MATFYLLPSRETLEGTLGETLGKVLPGLPLPVDSWDIIAEQLATAARWPDDVFLIPRDDLPDTESVGEALADGFGAEPGDRVVEVGTRSEPRVWTVEPPAVSVPGDAR